MSYRDEAPSWLGPLPKISWTLVAFDAALIILATAEQIHEAWLSEGYGIHVGWLGLLLTLSVFVMFETAAFLAASKRHYGVSIWFGGFVVGPLGLLLGFQLAQVGM